MLKPITVLRKWEKIPKKKRNGRLGRQMSAECGMRSMGEVRFAADLDKRKVVYEYEPETWEYQHKVQKYTPDFWLPEYEFFVEYKGKLTDQIRSKMLRVKDCNPDKDLRMVFERAANKIRKGSPTTYDKWAKQKGFLWSEHFCDDEWLR